MKQDKKGQEEMVGFVLIVLIVVIVALVILGIMISKKPNTQDAESSERIGSFLKSVSYYTTDCENPPTIYNNIEDLVKLCNEHDSCSDGKQACAVLSENLNNLLNASFLVKNESNIKGYTLNLKAGNNETEVYFIEPIINGEMDECSIKLYYDRHFVGIDNTPIMSLEICYRSV